MLVPFKLLSSHMGLVVLVLDSPDMEQSDCHRKFYWSVLVWTTDLIIKHADLLRFCYS